MHSSHSQGCSSRYCCVAARNLRLTTSLLAVRGLLVVGSNSPTYTSFPHSATVLRGLTTAALMRNALGAGSEWIRSQALRSL